MGRHKSYDRDLVLEKAMELFWAKGYEGTHLSELVKVTGLNRFGLYAEFGGKEGLFRAALDLYLKWAQETYRKTLDAKPHGLDNIRTYFEEMSFGDEYSGCFMVKTIVEQNVVTNEAFSAAHEVFLEAKNLFHKNLCAAKEYGQLPPDRDIDALANLLSVIDSGLSIYGIISQSDSEKNAIAQQALLLLASISHKDNS
ncbi:TetR/AcrR family transcriptional regulator [Kiloniella laminariae]|uniref:TetR/AcrR family transcriptional regulator n=1 Tax=Kiloniella laminariae TaxID=454162 RepID=A0ABT4LF82_9PROT|nr:TetR/AcrR family transcriptional regulator [Kiloniella laminariae]MCZ4279585.1 TetR/AcrR family transcriptional regulator [Kiloniella laminariae]